MRLLLVDDEAFFASVLARGLRAEHFVVDVENDGIGGYRMASTGAYDAIILDAMLPGMNGFDIVAGLRKNAVDTPTLMLTAKSGTEDELRALRLGADDFLRKPFSLPVLVARIFSLTRRPPALESTVFTVGDLIIDTRSRSVRRENVPVALGELEYAILLCLAKARGAVVEKQQLLFEVWSGEIEDPNVVEARVSSLRRKIDAPFGHAYLQTVRGFGYRLADDVTHGAP